MKKLLAFAFTILSLISVNLFAVEIRNVVDHGNGEYTIQRTSRGVEHTFHKGVDGSWTELNGDGSVPSPVSQSFAKALDSALSAYIIGKNACQQPSLTSQAPQPLEHLGEDLLDEDDGMGVGVLGDEEEGDIQDPDAAARLASRPAHKRDFSGELAADGSQSSEIQPKRKIVIDYAEIGRMARELRVLPGVQQQQPAPMQVAPVAEAPAAQQGQQQPEQEHGVPAVVVGQQVPQGVQPAQPLQAAGQPEFDWTSYSQALSGNTGKNCLIM